MKLNKSDVSKLIIKACEDKFDKKIQKIKEVLALKLSHCIEEDVVLGWEKYDKHMQQSTSISVFFPERFYDNISSYDSFHLCSKSTCEFTVPSFPYHGVRTKFYLRYEKDLYRDERLFPKAYKKDGDKLFAILTEKGNMMKDLWELLENKKSTSAIKKIIPEMEKYFPKEERKDLPEDSKKIKEIRNYFK